MPNTFRLQDVLTEFDDKITSELNVDPLGLQVIWSAYGQKIFRQRISSISNDVRNFTLNLFDHAVTKSLVEDDTMRLGRALLNHPAHAGRGKDSAAFKQACLIYLENLFAFTMVEAQDRPGVETGGILGIAKARRRWEETRGAPTLLFSADPKAHVLVRQNSLGVSGRYKTPLAEMKFFGPGHDYTLPESQGPWQAAERQLFSTTSLGSLRRQLVGHLQTLLASEEREPRIGFKEVPAPLRKSLVEAFRSRAAVGHQTRNFWLGVTELDRGAPGAIYNVLNDDRLPDGGLPTSTIFDLAARRGSLEPSERDKLNRVRLLEPFLAELDLLLQLVLSAKSQTVDDVLGKWTVLGRGGDTLPKAAARIDAAPDMQLQVAGTAAARLKRLLEISRSSDMRTQVRQLVAYHGSIMEDRRQPPWVRLVREEQLKVDVGTRPLPDESSRPPGAWVHQYYIPQFRNLLLGLRGVDA
ncbi:hypothetical protein [Rhizobacter sp. Root16D2]|uniref:hypothetical protein n=1 Tax=Rhizobacter sp. Root16D2 TaxID=1736479 RepID=UPI0006F87255|nr:hypothetical protein [Rhizobacter sp. Root16D2]KRB24757.1 hypothetical protein ASE08_00730 [Rhizobacter sp. Root16D2]